MSAAEPNSDEKLYTTYASLNMTIKKVNLSQKTH